MDEHSYIDFEKLAKAFAFNSIGKFKTDNANVNNFVSSMKRLTAGFNEKNVNTIKSTVAHLDLQNQNTVDSLSKVLISVLRLVFVLDKDTNWGRIAIGFKFIDEVIKTTTTNANVDFSRKEMTFKSAVLSLKTMLIEQSDWINQNGGLERGLKSFMNEEELKTNDMKIESVLKGFLIGGAFVYFLFKGIKLITN